MLVNEDRCVGCGQCLKYCPVNAISLVDGQANVDLDECVECYNCKRSQVCPTDALYQQKLSWPRTIRSLLSDVLTIAEESGISGRGTEEMKTNDVTGRFQSGYAGIAVELGRPTVGARIYDVEKVAMAVADIEGLEFEKANPVTSLMANLKTGKFKDDILQEKVLSAIVEFKVPLDKVADVLARLRVVEQQIDTVFSLAVCTKVAKDDTLPTEEIIKKAGCFILPNGKTNVGLGRPLKEEV